MIIIFFLSFIYSFIYLLFWPIIHRDLIKFRLLYFDIYAFSFNKNQLSYLALLYIFILFYNTSQIIESLFFSIISQKNKPGFDYFCNRIFRVM
jgi:hypothetical protein